MVIVTNIKKIALGWTKPKSFIFVAYRFYFYFFHIRILSDIFCLFMAFVLRFSECWRWTGWVGRRQSCHARFKWRGVIYRWFIRLIDDSPGELRYLVFTVLPSIFNISGQMREHPISKFEIELEISNSFLWQLKLNQPSQRWTNNTMYLRSGLDIKTNAFISRESSCQQQYLHLK